MDVRNYLLISPLPLKRMLSFGVIKIRIYVSIYPTQLCNGTAKCPVELHITGTPLAIVGYVGSFNISLSQFSINSNL
jgi:hypothetical protein